MSINPFHNLTSEMHVWHYLAPHGKQHPPRTVEKDIEEVSVIVAGRGRFCVDGKPFEANPGTMIWYHPGTTMQVNADVEEPYDAIVFRFRVNGKAEEIAPVFSSWIDIIDCERFCRRARKLFLGGSLNSPTMVFSYYARLHWEAMDYGRRGKENRHPAALRKAIQVIEENFLSPIEISEIVSASGVSSSQLYTLFRTYFGVSPLQLLIAKRIQHAQDELIRGEKTIKEICFSSGFSDISYFCACYRKHTGLSPNQYRNRFA